MQVLRLTAWGIISVVFLPFVTVQCFSPRTTIMSRRRSTFGFPGMTCACDRVVLFAKKSFTGEFEYLELKIQLDAMNKAGVVSRNLEVEKRTEIAQYAQQVAKFRTSPIALADIGKVIPGTSWRLAFSTEEAALGDLPSDATVYLNFIDEENVDYILRFSEKTLGLNSITAKSKWTCSQIPNPGLITFVYDKITADVFGMGNVGVGFFGLLKGRANYVESAYFDGQIWIELGNTPSGGIFVNVYVRE